LDAETKGMLRQLCLWRIARPRYMRCFLVFFVRGDVITLTFAFGCYRHELRTQATGLAFFSDVG